MNKWKDYSSASSYPRPLSSIIVSVALLAVFITFASWVLLSYPIGTAVRSYFYDVNGIGDLSSSNSWQNRTPSFNGNLGLPQLKDGDGVDANRAEGNKGSAAEKPIEVRNDEKTTPGIQWQNATSSEVSIGEKTTPGIQWLNATSGEVKSDEKTTPPGIQWQNTSSSEVNNTENVSLDANREERDNEKVKEKPSEFSNNENTTQVETQIKDAAAVDVNQENKDRQRADGGKINQTLGDNNPHPSGEGECDLFHGEWYYDESGPLYTNNSCPIITQMQNCQGNGRPDKGYESWRWKPSQCVLPRFDAHKFLELMRGKTLAFVGDSVARNQMESLLCILWQVEVPKNRGSRHMQRWFFKSKQVMIVRIWSSWLVHQTGDAFKDVPGGVTKVFLDVPDETFMEHVPKFDVVVLSSGHWFAKQSIYIQNNEIVGTQLWKPPNGQHYPVNNVEAFGISVETAMRALATHPNYKGITILRSYSPDHYEGGAWNTGGSCTGKVEPARPGNLVENGFTNIMHEKQVSGFEQGSKKQTNGSKLKLMDITEVFSYRHDGHPGPYRSPDPNKITKRGPDGRPPPQDCLHWCMPGPVDTWNEFVLEIIRREYEK